MKLTPSAEARPVNFNIEEVDTDTAAHKDEALSVASAGSGGCGCGSCMECGTGCESSWPGFP